MKQRVGVQLAKLLLKPLIGRIVVIEISILGIVPIQLEHIHLEIRNPATLVVIDDQLFDVGEVALIA